MAGLLHKNIQRNVIQGLASCCTLLSVTGAFEWLVSDATTNLIDPLGVWAVRKVGRFLIWVPIRIVTHLSRGSRCAELTIALANEFIQYWFSLRAAGVDVYDVSRKIGQMFSKMIFDDGYVHCDPHPGNVLVQKDSAGNTQVRFHLLFKLFSLFQFKVNRPKCSFKQGI